MDRPVAFDVHADSITLVWSAPFARGDDAPASAPPSLPPPSRYAVEIATAADPTKVDCRGWDLVSDTLTGTGCRKKHLTPETAYVFRVRAFVAESWTPWSRESKVVRTISQASALPGVRMDAPSLVGAAGHDRVAVQWKAAHQAKKYAVELMDQSAPPLSWVTVSEKLSGLAVRKKGLTGGRAYVFRVRPFVVNPESGFGEWQAWSTPSAPVVTPLPAAPGFKSLLGETLCRADGTEVTTDVIGGKLVLLYFSAHWCPPCRKFTPMLATFYAQARAMNLPLEVIFVSSDKSEAEAQAYMKEAHGNWLTIPFHAPARQGAAAYFRVRGIPKLMVFGPLGETVCDNAVGMPLNAATVEAWWAQAKKNADNANAAAAAPR